jgi:hypothetical protein
MNGNSYYITTFFIPYNTDSYYSVITITTYQTCPNNVRIYHVRNESGINILFKFGDQDPLHLKARIYFYEIRSLECATSFKINNSTLKTNLTIVNIN